jgi:hypothetical protein
MRILISLLIFMNLSSAFARSGRIEAMEVRGPIALGLGLGYGNDRLMNTDGTWASYRGISYLGALEVRVLSFGDSSLAIFGDYSYGVHTDASDESAKLEHQGSTYGVRLYANPMFFVGIGQGSASEKVTTNGINTTLRHSSTKMEMGIQWGIGGSWALGVQGRYQLGPVSKEDNSSLTSNSSYDSAEAFFMLIWSPPILLVQGKN